MMSRIALVTGASKGVGRGIAYGLADNGWDVAINYCHDEAGAHETANKVQKKGHRSWILQSDVGYKDQVEDMFNRLLAETGQLDLLVNNSGVQTWCPLLELSEEDWDRTLRTNLKGTFLCTQQAARAMKGKGGCIINIGSGCSKVPFPNLVDYTASKGGINNFTMVAALELGPHNIRVNSVAPGAIEIERTRLESPEYAATWGPITPMRRIGYVEDVAAAVVFLATPQASFITGQTLYVDGGLFTQPMWPAPKESERAYGVKENP